MDIENVTHIFQLPLSFFRALARLLKLHAGDGISYEPDGDDGPVVSLDTRRVQELVEEVGGGGGAKAPTSTSAVTSGYVGNSSAHTALTTGGFTAGAAGGQGRTIQLACRGTDDGYDGAIFFRTFTITSDGRIYAWGGETSQLGVRTDQS